MVEDRRLTHDERRALRALRGLGKIWPRSLTLMTSESSLIVVDSETWRELGPGLMPEGEILQQVDTIPVDTWNP